jgi:hypothetical protein
MSDKGQTSTAREWLTNHPRLIGYLLAILMLTQSIGTVAAGSGCNGM